MQLLHRALGKVARASFRQVRTVFVFPFFCSLSITAVWDELLPLKESTRYRAVLRDQYALTWKDWKHCPKDDCRNVVHWHGKVNLPVNCLCSFRWCYACQDEKIGDHSPATCEEVAAWLKKFNSESENLLFIRANTRMCPKCRSPIEKNGGCMHMTCRKCRHEFCWICFGDVGSFVVFYVQCLKLFVSFFL